MSAATLLSCIKRGIDPAATYTDAEIIGEGNYGDVYKARLKSTGEVVAVKIVKHNPDDAEELEDFQVEIEILKKCNHPNIIKMYDCYYWKDALYMILEYCDGGSMDDIYQEIQLDEAQIRSIIKQMLEALNYLHETAHVFHRDIKAGNILLNQKGQVKLADFGVSAKNQSKLSKRDSFIGTPFWMAPEVILCEHTKTRPYDNLCDVWSVGITAIELAEMNPPLHQLHMIQALYRIPKASPPILAQPELWSRSFHDFLTKCLQKDPYDRLSVKKLLQHDWITYENTDKSCLVRLVEEYNSLEVEEESDDDEMNSLTGSEPDMSSIANSMSNMSINNGLASANNLSKGSTTSVNSTTAERNDKRRTVVRTTYKVNKDGTRRKVTRRIDSETEKASMRIKELRNRQIRQLKRLNREDDRKALVLKLRREREQFLEKNQLTREQFMKKKEQGEIDRNRYDDRKIGETLGTQQKDWKQKLNDFDISRKKEIRNFKEQQNINHKNAVKKVKEELKHFGKLDRKDKRAEFEENLAEKEVNENMKFIDSTCLRDSKLIHQYEIMQLEEYEKMSRTQMDSSQHLQIEGLQEYIKLETELINGYEELQVAQLRSLHSLENEKIKYKQGVEREMMDALCNKRLNECKRRQAAIKKVHPRKQKVEYREAYKKLCSEKEREHKRLKDQHRQIRDTSGKKKKERMEMKKSHEVQEQMAIKNLEEDFKDCMTEKQTKDTNDMNEKLDLEMECTIEQNNVDEDELHLQQKEKVNYLMTTHKEQCLELADKLKKSRTLLHQKLDDKKKRMMELHGKQQVNRKKLFEEKMNQLLRSQEECPIVVSIDLQKSNKWTFT